MDLRVEYVNTAPNPKPTAWYIQGDYPPTFHERLFGHHVGSNADSIFTRLTGYILPNLQLGVDFNLETQG